MNCIHKLISASPYSRCSFDEKPRSVRKQKEGDNYKMTRLPSPPWSIPCEWSTGPLLPSSSSIICSAILSSSSITGGGGESVVVVEEVDVGVAAAP
ncbi:hypothetical protein EJB05_41486 [Eragrostis curvula]|uniref:Uncharacterized protein n=1 Tax=Eragrostis curvula TaxID=38414 RepID=A0A5J9T9L2_9POAL|nr:hypothetical protein EJB05_41486 [Eragrostis curvula]